MVIGLVVGLILSAALFGLGVGLAAAFERIERWYVPRATARLLGLQLQEVEAAYDRLKSEGRI